MVEKKTRTPRKPQLFDVNVSVPFRDMDEWDEINRIVWKKVGAAPETGTGTGKREFGWRALTKDEADKVKDKTVKAFARTEFVPEIEIFPAHRF